MRLEIPTRTEAPRRAAKPPTCDRCARKITKIGADGNETRFAISAGYIPLGEQPADDWGSAAGLAEALDRGACCLCTCAEGRWWRDWFAELADPLSGREGRMVDTGFRMPAFGIPEFGARA